jgi:hypothetical protein
VLVAAATLLSAHKVPRGLIGLLFVVGALLAGLSILANKTQHSYYVSARKLKAKLEKRLGLGEVALQTTPGMGSGIARLGRVGTFLTVMLVAIGLVDLVGAGLAFGVGTSEDADTTRRVEVVARLPAAAAAGFATTVVAADGEGTPVQSRELGGRVDARPFRLLPGDYTFWVAGRTLCRRPVSVAEAPLMIVRLHC